MIGRRLPLLLAVGGVLLAGAVAWWASDRGGGGDFLEPTPLQQVLRELDEDGNWSQETALRAFAAVVGPLPGVTVPEGPEPAIEFGTVAFRMLSRYFDEITAEQRRAAIAAAGPLAGHFTGEPATTAPTDDTVGLAPGTHAMGGDPAVVAATDEYETLIDGIVAGLGSRVGRSLGIDIDVVISPNPVGNLYAHAKPIASDGVNVSRCEIVVLPNTQNIDGDRRTAVLAHEVWHCFEYDRLGTLARKNTAPPWILEGQAMWVGEAYVGGSEGLEPTIRHWNEYLLDPGPGVGLFARSYDAIGFYSHLADEGIDPWTVLVPMLEQTSNLAAYGAAVGGRSLEVVTSWAPSWYRDGAPTGTFALVNAPGILPTTVRPVPISLTIANGIFQQVGALWPLSAALGDVEVTAEILVIDVMGQAVVGDMMFGEEIVFQGGSRTYCMIEDCSCPDGSPGPSEHLGESLRVAVTGDELSGSDALLRGWAVAEWCGEEEDDENPPPPGSGGGPDRPCGSGCASSNGDPHLTTVDGGSYDFQAAGEFTLLRADGVEIQARQQPYRGSTSVTINTAVAVGVGGTRAAVYAGGSGLEVRIEGEPHDLSTPVTGDGIEVRQVPDGVELALADGTVVWALNIGEWGINVVVAPSDAMRTQGAGLLGAVGDGLLPRLANGDAADTDDPRDAIYEDLAGSWEVTEPATLFDYPDGLGPASFRDRSVPEAGSPLAFDELDTALQAAGLAACAGIDDPALLVQCAFDVAVTDDVGFVESYGSTERFLTTTAIEPTEGSIEGGDLEPLLTEVAAIPGVVLGDDGNLYLSVRFDDRHRELVAVDPDGQQILHRVDLEEDGQLVAAAASIWMSTTTPTGCAVVRYALASLAEEARIDVPCPLSVLAPQIVAGDGAAFVYQGAPELVRIDPATNTLEDGIELPFPNGFLRSTDAAIFYSDVREGTLRLLHGAATFEDVGSSGLVVHPGGTGVWEERDGAIAFFDGSSAPTASFPSDGSLVGATVDGALVERRVDAGPELWAHPLTGAEPVPLAAAPTVGSGSGQRLLDYRDPFGDQLLVAESQLVKVWLEISSGPSDETGVFVQAIDLP